MNFAEDALACTNEIFVWQILHSGPYARIFTAVPVATGRIAHSSYSVPWSCCTDARRSQWTWATVRQDRTAVTECSFVDWILDNPGVVPRSYHSILTGVCAHFCSLFRVKATIAALFFDAFTFAASCTCVFASVVAESGSLGSGKLSPWTGCCGQWHSLGNEIMLTMALWDTVWISSHQHSKKHENRVLLDTRKINVGHWMACECHDFTVIMFMLPVQMRRKWSPRIVGRSQSGADTNDVLMKLWEWVAWETWCKMVAMIVWPASPSHLQPLKSQRA